MFLIYFYNVRISLMLWVFTILFRVFTGLHKGRRNTQKKKITTEVSTYCGMVPTTGAGATTGATTGAAPITAGAQLPFKQFPVSQFAFIVHFVGAPSVTHDPFMHKSLWHCAAAVQDAPVGNAHVPLVPQMPL